MEFWERMRNAFDRGLEKSKDLLGRARDTAQDLGERGVLRYEIMQLENQAETIVGKLGAACYEPLANDESVNRSSAGVSDLIDQIDAIQTRIKEKEAALELLKRSGGKGSEEDRDLLDNK